MPRIYGLKNCDTCKKAVKSLRAAGVAHDFIDIRAEADLADRVPVWLAAVGGKPPGARLAPHKPPAAKSCLAKNKA